MKGVVMMKKRPAVLLPALIHACTCLTSRKEDIVPPLTEVLEKWTGAGDTDPQ